MHLLKGFLLILHKKPYRLVRAEGPRNFGGSFMKMRNYNEKLTKIVHYCGKLTFLKKTVNLGGKLKIPEKLAGKLSVIFPLRGGAINPLSPV